MTDKSKAEHGQWIDVTNSESSEPECACSVCGFEIFRDTVDKLQLCYCPICKAKMEGEWKEE